MAYKFNPTTGKLDTVADPGGSDTQVQFNDGGVFGAASDLTFNKTTKVMKVTGDVNLDDGGTYTTTLQTVTPTANRTISLPNATGTVALVAGSSGQLTYNNAGANAGLSTTSIDGSGNITLSGRFISSLNGAASAPPATLTGTWFTGGTATTTKPQFLVEPTGTTSTAWSTSGTGIGVNAASGFAGNLLDLQVNGTSLVSAKVNSGWSIFKVGTTFYADDLQGRATLYSSGQLGWSSGVLAGDTSTQDLTLRRDAANTLAQRNGTNAQTTRLYNTYTDASNYERLSIDWTSNVCYARPQNAGTGSARLFVPVTGSTTVASLPSASTAGAGARAFVTDANATTFLSTVAGGGANKVPVVSDGTNWLIG